MEQSNTKTLHAVMQLLMRFISYDAVPCLPFRFLLAFRIHGAFPCFFCMSLFLRFPPTFHIVNLRFVSKLLGAVRSIYSSISYRLQFPINWVPSLRRECC